VNVVYLESSAAAKLVAVEPETTAMRIFVNQLHEGDVVVSSALMETELRRMAIRREIEQRRVTFVLSRVTLVHVTRDVLRSAATFHDAALRSLDAIHVATAISADADLVVAYDHRLIAAAESVGLSTISPA